MHAVGEDGAYSGTWLESIESQVIEGGTGDFIMVGGRRQPSLSVQVREGGNGELFWQEGGKTVNYYISDKGNKEKYHKDVCPGGSEVEVKVTGKIVEKDGKKMIEDAKVEKK